MKRFTTIICCIALMIAGVATAFQDFSMPGNQTAMAQPLPLQWNVSGKLPLDLQLDLEKRLPNESPTIRDSVVIRDSIIVKTKWKTRYKDVARAKAHRMGNDPTTATPDSMSVKPFLISTPDREEQPGEYVGSPKEPTIQLRVDGVIVYNSEDEIHSTGEGQ